MVNATSDAESSSESETVGAHTLADGSFEFPRLHRGRWSVTAVAPPAGAVVREVNVVDKDIDELEIRLAEPFTLNVKIVRDPPPANPQSKTEMRVFLIAEGNSDVREGSIDAGEFPVTRHGGSVPPRATTGCCGLDVLLLPRFHPRGFVRIVVNPEIGRKRPRGALVGQLVQLAYVRLTKKTQATDLPRIAPPALSSIATSP